MYMRAFPAYISTYHVCAGVLRSQQTVLDTPKAGVVDALGHCVGAGNRTPVLWKYCQYS